MENKRESKSIRFIEVLKPPLCGLLVVDRYAVGFLIMKGQQPLAKSKLIPTIFIFTLHLLCILNILWPFAVKRGRPKKA